jgi:hypothetical protein
VGVTTVYRLEDLLADPALLEPPHCVLPRLGWAGRLTMLAAPEKSGKSTLLGQAIAAKATGREFLGEPMTRGTSLWMGLDEPLNDIVRRFDRYGARDRVVITQEIPGPAELRELIHGDRQRHHAAPHPDLRRPPGSLHCPHL